MPVSIGPVDSRTAGASIVRGDGVTLAAIVLAAGASTRMGRAKALIEWRGQSFLRRVVGLAESTSCAPILAVEGAIPLPAHELGSAARVVNTSWSNGQLSSLQVGLAALIEHLGPSESRANVTPIDQFNRTTIAGHSDRIDQRSTVHSNHLHLDEDKDEDKDKNKKKNKNNASITGVMVLAIDRPRIQPSTCQALAAAHRREPLAIWQPTADARRGHPIIYPRQLFAELLALPSTEGPRQWLRSPTIAARRRYLPVVDPAIFENFDRPADLDDL